MAEDALERMVGTLARRGEAERRRALVIVNPHAAAVSDRVRTLVVGALESRYEVEAMDTQYRGHAIEISREAAQDPSYALVIALGGDGTVNEVVNGLLGEGPGPDVPRLAVVPGGSTNVFARALGMPTNPVEATGLLLDAVRERRTRPIGLGRADERWFTFCAGVGLDAEVVRRVEEHRAEGHVATPSLYVRATLRHFFTATDRSQPRLTLERPGQDPIDGLFMVIVANTSPWTYVGDRPVTPTPRASFDTALDLFGLRTLRTLPTFRHAGRLLSGKEAEGRSVVSLHDEPELTLHAKEPIACQIDGEAVGELARVTFRATASAVHVMV